jgi:glycogen operon protein
MLCGSYALLDKKHTDWDFYLAYNFHWEPHEYEMPLPVEKKSWEILLDTSAHAKLEEKVLCVPERSVVVLAARTARKAALKKGQKN